MEKDKKKLLIVGGISLGCSTLYFLFPVAVAILFLLGFFEDSDSNFDDVVLRTNECGFTISSTSLSKSEYKEKLETYADSYPNFRIFADNADDIYEYAKSKSVNPELVPVRAQVEGHGGTTGTNNYWGLGCNNGEGIEACKDYSSFEEGYSDFVNIASQYDSLASMFAKYAYIGYFWYNPGDSDDGGCYYAPHMFDENNIPDRVKKACYQYNDNAPTCSTLGDADQRYKNTYETTGVNPRPECTPTTAEDQDVYARYQIEVNMASARKSIFGLEFDDGPCATTSLSMEINNYISENTENNSIWAVYVKNLDNNEIVNINAGDKMVAASEIKLFIMAALYDKVNSGEITESDIKSYVSSMITVSDNASTNTLIDKYGMDMVNEYINNNGYSNSILQRKMLTSGNENYTSAEDLGVLLEKIYNLSLVSATHSNTMLNFLKQQERVSKIPKGIPDNVTVANKTGELDNVENDAAIVYSNDANYIIVVLSNNLSNTSEAVNDIVEISRIVYEYYNN